VHRLLVPLLLLAAPPSFRVGCDCDGGSGIHRAGPVPGHDAGPVDAGLSKVGTLSDDFDDNATGAIWTSSQAAPASQVREVNQRLEISLDGLGAAYAGYRTAARYDATDTAAWVELAAVGPQFNAHEMILSYVGRTLDQFVYVEVNSTAIFGGYAPGDGGGYFVAADAGWTAVRFLRLREQAGTMTWEYSADGGEYHSILVRPTPIDLSSVQVDLSAGLNAPTGTPILDAFDNLNR